MLPLAPVRQRTDSACSLWTNPPWRGDLPAPCSCLRLALSTFQFLIYPFAVFSRAVTVSKSTKKCRRAFTLLELLVVISIIAILLVAVIPAVTGLSKGSGRKGAVSNLMNALEQARSLALTSGSATYVVFADETTPDNYRCKAFIIFKEDKTTFVPTAVTRWYFPSDGDRVSAWKWLAESSN